MTLIRTILSILKHLIYSVPSNEDIEYFHHIKDILGHKYIDYNETNLITDRLEKICQDIKKRKAWFKNKVEKHIILLQKKLPEIIKTSNEEFIESEIETKSEQFAYVGGYKLDRQQLEIAISDEINTLAIAGAGSGKTTTIIGKVQYLTNVLGVDAKDILIMAYNKKAAEELDYKFKTLGKDVKVSTFHKFGLDVIKKQYGRNINIFEEDELKKTIVNYFKSNIQKDKKNILDIIKYIGLYNIDVPYEEDFITYGEYIFAQKNFDRETLKSKVNAVKNKNVKNRQSIQGEQLKSMEEVIIANFLFLNGVKYEYEKPYPKADTKYTPDFYLPEYDIWWEHFGINEQGRCPWLKHISEEKYIEGIKWKRNLHSENKTKLIESYSFWKKADSKENFVSRIKDLLLANGVKLNPNSVDKEALCKVLYNDSIKNQLAELEKLCATFIRLYKENHSETTLYELLTNQIDLTKESREKSFFDVIVPIYTEYEEKLKENKAIDFSDMIRKATDCIEKNGNINSFKYILVDEFQDISRGRCNLVKAIIAQTKAKLLCVGDDWQAIYHFAGSDIEYILNFEKYFGYSNLLKIEQTYRYSKEVISVVEPFIMRNKAQLPKKMVSNKEIENPIEIIYHDTTDFNKKQALEYVVDKIVETDGLEQKILLLGRNNFDIDFLTSEGKWKINKQKNEYTYKYKGAKEIKLEFSTVHSAKGLEADNIILVNSDNDMLGFPNKMADDSILKLVLSSADMYLYAEERRLFYVALTRTKKRVYILTTNEKPSIFIQEIKNNRFVENTNFCAKVPTPHCPRCETGHLAIRENNGKEFVGCTNYPYCDFTCPTTEVLKEAKVCPSCNEGYLIVKEGKYGKFYGCSNYPDCTYTQDFE